MEGEGRDRISELPVDILHSILLSIQHSRTLDQTATLSRQWRSIWRSYPVAEFNDNGETRLLKFQHKTIQAFRRKKINKVSGDKLLIKLNRRIRNASQDKLLKLNEVDIYAKAEADLQRFRDTTIDRYSRDNLLPLEKLKLSIFVKIGTFSSSCVDELLELALKRKTGEVEIDVTKHSREPGIKLPLTALFNYTVKILRLSRVMFDNRANLPLSPTALRFLHLDNVEFEEDGILTNLIANSPHLETLEFVCPKNLKKLQVSNVGSLKNLKIEHYHFMEEIEIVAPRLQSLYLGISPEFKFKLTAPQLNLLQISTYGTIITSAYLDTIFRACHPKRMIAANTFSDYSNWHECFNWRKFFNREELHGWRGQLKDVVIEGERNTLVYISFVWHKT